MSMFSSDKRKALVVGHSHIAALATAYRIRCKKGHITPCLSFVALNEEKHKPFLNGNGQLNTTLSKTIKDTIDSVKPQATFITLSGTMHIVLGLANHPENFTLFHEDASGKPEVKFISYGLIKSVMETYMETHLSALCLLVGQLPKPVYGIEPPPPIKDEEYIHSILSGRHLENITQYGIAAPIHRLRMWELEVEILRNAYNEVGISLLTVPSECCDADGFRHPRAWHVDPAHGNVWYGERVLIQIDRILEELL